MGCVYASWQETSCGHVNNDSTLDLETARGLSHSLSLRGGWGDWINVSFLILTTTFCVLSSINSQRGFFFSNHGGFLILPMTIALHWPYSCNSLGASLSAMLFFKTKSVGLGLSYLPQTQMWKYQTVMWLEPCKHFKFACGTKTPAFGQRVLSGSIFTFLLDFSSSLFTQWLVRFRRQNHLITVKMDPFTKLTIGYKA